MPPSILKKKNLLTGLDRSTRVQPGMILPPNRFKTHPEDSVNRAIREGLAGYFYKALLKSGAITTLDRQYRERLQSQYFFALRHNLKLVSACKQILKAANNRKIKIVLIQGISLIQSVYHDIGIRPLADIDLWILKSDYPVIKDILISRGYTTEYMYPLNFKNKDISIDLHLHILWADRIRARKGLLQTDQQVLFDRAGQVQFEGQPAYVLDPLDQVIYLGLHLLKHNAERLIWLVDIQRLVEGWDDTRWKALVHRAGQLGQTKCLLYVCFLLQRLLNMRFTDEISGRLKQLSVVEKKILRYRESKGSLPRWSTLLFFPAGKGLAKSLPFVFETLFPKADILRQVFPDSAGLNGSQLYTRRTRQLLAMLKSR